MSTRAYLEKLDLDQLKFARDVAIELITAKEAEPKHLIWQVCDDYLALKHFAANDYLAAVEYLLNKAKQLALDPATQPCRKKLQIDYIRVPASEIKDYLPDTV